MNDYEQNPGQLADLLDTVLPPNQADVLPFDGNDLVQAAERLANAPHPALSPEAMARIQKQVIQAARQQQAPRRIIRLDAPLLRWAAVFILLFLGYQAALPAVAGSLPGNPLYAVKRGFESVELLLAVSPATKADVYLDQASRRLEESQTLLKNSQFDHQLIQIAHDDISQSLQQKVIDTYALIEARAAQLRADAHSIVRAAIAAGLVQPEDVIDLLPVPTVMPTLAPATTLTATVQPSVTPSATATSTPSPTTTALPTATPSQQPTSAPTTIATERPTLPPTTVPTEPPTAVPTIVNTPVVIIQPTPDNGYTIGDSNVNVRKGPGTEFEIIAVLPPGTPLEIIGKSETGDWEHVRLLDGRAGWVAASLVRDKPVVPQPQDPTVNQPGENQQPDGGCAHPGSYCNAPGQQKNDTPGDNGATPGPNKNDHPPGNDNNNGRDDPPNNPGPPPDKPPKNKDK